MKAIGRAFSPLEVRKDYDADIAIIGGGLSRLSAALTAAEIGVRAIILEKLPFLGGAGIFPEGSLGIGTRYQKENGITTTTDQVFAKVMEFHHWRCNATVIRTLLNESGRTIDWHATGQDMGGLYDSTYGLLAEGSASSFALSSGRIAAQNIAQAIRADKNR